jgi:hypothetical protein
VSTYSQSQCQSKPGNPLGCFTEQFLNFLLLPARPG